MKRIVGFGEMLLRLGARGHEPLLHGTALEAGFGGAEANVAWALAGLGLEASMVTVLPDNPLGDACAGELRRHGVGTTGVIRQTGRMGLYFLTRGATLRPAQVVYDRAGSAFALADPQLHDWSSQLTGAGWLHVSGITPALSSAAEHAVVAALDAAGKLGVAVSFDCNYRPSLWHGREREAVRVLRDLASRSRLLFASRHDVELLFAVDCTKVSTADGLERAASAAFAACPELELLATTDRVVHGPDHHDLTGYLADRKGVTTSRTVSLQPIVDRIGAGDAYAAGILYGLSRQFDRARTVEFAITLAALKHGVPGDFIIMSADDVASAMTPGARDVRR
jgi:2-dehydro-3-deoxygluconokinase